MMLLCFQLETCFRFDEFGLVQVFFEGWMLVYQFEVYVGF